MFIHILSAIFLFNLQSVTANEKIVGGTKISEAAIKNMFSTIRTSGSLGVQIGPRVFLTCGHCITSPHSIISNIPNKNCDLELSRFVSNDTLDSKAVVHCTDAGEMDLALIVQAQPVEGKMLTVNLNPISIGEELIVLGGGRTDTSEAWTCGGYNGYHYATKSIVDLIDNIIVFEGVDRTGSPSPYTCAGDSGGQYFKLLETGNIEISGIHAWGFEKGRSFSRNQINYILPSLFGGTNLAHERTITWFNRIIEDENLEICGINLDCKPVKWNPNFMVIN
jgi:hypothetical protein